MFFRKIQGPLRIDTPDDTVTEYPLSPSRGGSSTKVVQYMVKVFIYLILLNLRLVIVKLLFQVEIQH